MKRIFRTVLSRVPQSADRGGRDTPIDGWRFYGQLVERREAAVLVALMVVASLTEGIGLLMLIPIARTAVGQGASDAEGLAPEWLGGLSLGQALAIFVALIVVRALLQMVAAVRSSRLILVATERLRIRTQHALLGAQWRWLARQESATLGNLVLYQSARVASHLAPVLGVVAGAITAVVLSLTASALAPVFTAAVVTMGLVVALPISLLRGRGHSEGQMFVTASETLQRLVNNGVSHLRAARIAEAESWLGAAFDDAAADVRESEMRFETRMAQARALLQVLVAAALALLVYAAIAWRAVPIAVLVPVLAIFARLLPIALTMQQARRSWAFTRPAIVELQELVRQAHAHVEDRPVEAAVAPQLERTLEARGIVLRAKDRKHPIVGPISFDLARGAIATLSGPSGSGKSTLADILSGLVPPDDGHVLIDGAPLDGPQRVAWRGRVSYVEQQPFFWPASVRDNLTWRRDDVSTGEIEDCLRAAAAEFVFDLPGALDYRLGDQGRPLSGGERHRLSFARALLKQPDLLIVDEVLASLNPALQSFPAAHQARLVRDNS